MLNEWSDRKPDPPRRRSAFPIVLAVIMALAVIGMVGQLALSILGE